MRRHRRHLSPHPSNGNRQGSVRPLMAIGLLGAIVGVAGVFFAIGRSTSVVPPRAAVRTSPAPTTAARPTPRMLTEAQLTAVAKGTYEMRPLAGTQSTLDFWECDVNATPDSGPTACPFSSALRARFLAVKGHEHHVDPLCRCQGFPMILSYTAAVTQGGGTVTVNAAYGSGPAPYILSIISENGKPVVDDIAVRPDASEPGCPAVIHLPDTGVCTG